MLYYLRHKHFDWSYLEKWFDMAETDVFILLRNPVERMISHFYFHKTLPFGKSDEKFQNQTLTEFLNDSESMMKHRGLWADGYAAIWWLTGKGQIIIILIIKIILWTKPPTLLGS